MDIQEYFLQQEPAAVANTDHLRTSAGTGQSKNESGIF